MIGGLPQFSIISWDFQIVSLPELSLEVFENIVQMPELKSLSGLPNSMRVPEAKGQELG